MERASGYLDSSFLPGRSFTGPEDFNTQLVQRLGTANTRRVHSIAARPTERIDPDRAAMLPLPARAPATGHRVRVRVRLGRGYDVKLAGNDY